MNLIQRTTSCQAFNSEVKTVGNTTNRAFPHFKHKHPRSPFSIHSVEPNLSRDALICNIHHTCKIHWPCKCSFSQKQHTKFKMVAKMRASRDHFEAWRNKSEVLWLHSWLLLLPHMGAGLYQLAIPESLRSYGCEEAQGKLTRNRTVQY